MMLERYELPASLSGQLRTFERRLRRMELVVALAGAGLGLALSWLALYLSDRLWDTPWPLRLGCALAGAAACLWGARYWFWRWVLRRRNVRDLAQLIQREHRRLGDRLQGVVELVQAGPQADISPTLVRAAIRQVAAEAERVDFRRAVKGRRAAWLAGTMGGLGLATAGLFAFNPAAATNALRRWLQPLGAVDRYTFVSLAALPAELVVAHGEPFPLRVGVTAESFLQPQTAWARLGLQPPLTARFAGGQAEFAVPGQTQDGWLTLRVMDAGRRIRVVPQHRPALEALAARVDYPAYLQRAAAPAPVSGGRLTTLAGSRLTFQGRVGRALSAASITVNGAAPAQPLTLTADGFTSAALAADTLQTASFLWTDSHGLTARKPYPVEVRTVADAAPAAECPAQPRYEALLVDDAKEIAVEATDDFGLSRLGVRWFVSDAQGNRLPTASVSRELATGGPTATKLSGTFILAPTLLNLPEQTIVTLVATTADYFPGREEVVSPEHKVYILSRAEHAREIQRRLEELQARVEELVRAEESLQDQTTDLAQRDAKELATAETGEKVRDLDRTEAANQQDLERLARQALALLEEAMRNKDFDAAMLKELAQLGKGLQTVARQPMSRARQRLAQAQQQPNQRPEKLREAGQEQAESVRQLQELLKNFNDSLENLTAENFINRLRRLAGEEQGIKDQLQTLLPKLVGAAAASLPAAVRRDLSRVETRGEDAWRATEVLLDDLSHFATRTRLAKHEAVLAAMQQASVVDQLEAHLEVIRANRTMAAMQQAEFWAGEFERWAKLLEDPNAKPDANGQSGQLTAEQLEFMLKVLRLIQDEQNVRAKTRLLERRREFDDAYGPRTGELAGRQDELQRTLDELRAKAPPAAAATFRQAGKAMTDASALLRVPQTDGVTVAAETEVIELLSAGFSQSAQAMGGGQGMSGLLQQLLQQLGLGGGAGGAGGGSMAGGSGDLADAARSPGGTEDLDTRTTEKAAGQRLDQAPVEFRDALKTYFNELDQLER